MRLLTWCTLVRVAVHRVSCAAHARVLYNRAREPLQWAALEALEARLSLSVSLVCHAHLLVCWAALGQRVPARFYEFRISTFIARNSAGFRPALPLFLLCFRLCVRLVCASPLPFARRKRLQHSYYARGFTVNSDVSLFNKALVDHSPSI